jgi:hypothetical protein
MTPVTLVLPFLGERTYLHGTTLLSALGRLIPQDACRSCFRISRRIETNCVRVTSVPTASAELKGCDARLDWDGGALAVRQLPCVGTIAREAYDEAVIADRCAVDGVKITFRGTSPYDPVATAVPMFKLLLHANGLTPAGGQWMFTRLDTRRAMPAFERMSLTLRQHLPKRISMSEIESDGAKIADFYFSWVSA